MSIKHIVIVALAVAGIVGCDNIDRPYTESPVDPGPDTGKYVKQNILLEDYTGHTCGNCPEAAEIADQISATYGDDRVIVVAVHAGPFALPDKDYPTDYRTPEGTILDNTFRISRAGNPNGMVNRITRNGRLIIGKDQWSTVVRDLIDDTAKVDLKLQTSYDSATRQITAAVDIEYMTAGTPDYQIVGLLMENGIVGDQTDYRKTPSHIKDYVFKHVMRTHFNGAWGEALSTTDVPKGTKMTKTLTYTIPSDKTWDPKKCDVVVYVHRHSTTKDILQAVKAKLVKP
jgi:thiol-disulfide isomerase/thioredoxin